MSFLEGVQLPLTEGKSAFDTFVRHGSPGGIKGSISIPGRGSIGNLRSNSCPPPSSSPFNTKQTTRSLSGTTPSFLPLKKNN